MKNFLLLLILFAVGIYLGSGWLLEKGTREALARWGKEARLPGGMAVEQIDFKSARLVSWNEASWKNVSMRLKFPEGAGPAAGRTVSLQAAEAGIRLKDPGKRIFEFRSRGLALALRRSGKTAVSDRLQIDEVEADLPLDLGNPRQALGEARRFAREIVRLVTEGWCSAAVRFSGKARFHFKGRRLEARLEVARETAGSRLILNADDLRAISGALKEKMTEAEIFLVSRNPLRAEKLLAIRDAALTASEEAHARDSAVPQDAYRHVLWSYLLTEAYGESFANLVTDAHELGRTGNTPAEKKMDDANNIVGRRYARAGAAEPEILKKLMRDPQVVRAPA